MLTFIPCDFLTFILALQYCDRLYFTDLQTHPSSISICTISSSVAIVHISYFTSMNLKKNTLDILLV